MRASLPPEAKCERVESRLGVISSCRYWHNGTDIVIAAAADNIFLLVSRMDQARTEMPSLLEMGRKVLCKAGSFDEPKVSECFKQTGEVVNKLYIIQCRADENHFTATLDPNNTRYTR